MVKLLAPGGSIAARAVPPSQCPVCQSVKFRLLESPSDKASRVKYYRCAACGHVWTTAKDDSGKVTHITPLPTTKRDA